MKRLLIFTLSCMIAALPVLAAQTTITQEGAFDRTVRMQINDNFDELYNVVVDATQNLVAKAASFTLSPSADSATTNNLTDFNLTTPVDTTGTNTHNAANIDLTVGNATGGTNSLRGLNISAVTGDAQVNVTGINLAGGTVLGTSTGLAIAAGWDKAADFTSAATADSGATDMGLDLNLTTPVDTTGTNIHYGLNIDTTIGNASGGTNTATAINIANVTGDAQVTETALKIGTGFDSGITMDSGLQINSTNGTAITAFRFATDAVANGQTSKTVTLTGVTSGSKCVASLNEVATNSISVRSAAPGTDQVVVTVSGDPGASNADLTVICLN